MGCSSRNSGGERLRSFRSAYVDSVYSALPPAPGRLIVYENFQRYTVVTRDAGGVGVGPRRARRGACAVCGEGVPPGSRQSGTVFPDPAVEMVRKRRVSCGPNEGANRAPKPGESSRDLTETQATNRNQKRSNSHRQTNAAAPSLQGPAGTFRLSHEKTHAIPAHWQYPPSRRSGGSIDTSPRALAGTRAPSMSLVSPVPNQGTTSSPLPLSRSRLPRWSPDGHND